ncbi:hypothetical protein DHEL01_v210011 [Diaporthe helianthi]|uniref:Apple domain-containing protein n=1 Tax=Diaporthe helianthi TaxID=158607 RepID=A0A2P5HMX3_DIAHE|nr:hypothetical protein DHEL01_v210011 [Diaporthe helianthi]
MPVVTVDRRSDICGVRGHYRDRGDYYFWSDSKQLASYPACSAQCASSDRCESFGFNGQVCMLFEMPLADNFDPDRQSSVKYFDVGCIQKDDTTLTKTVTTVTHTITRSIVLATGTGRPWQLANGTTGFYPVHRTGTANRFPLRPTTSSTTETAASAPSPTADVAATETAAADSTSGDVSELDSDSQINDGILAPTSNQTSPQND